MFKQQVAKCDIKKLLSLYIYYKINLTVLLHCGYHHQFHQLLENFRRNSTRKLRTFLPNFNIFYIKFLHALVFHYIQRDAMSLK